MNGSSTVQNKDGKRQAVGTEEAGEVLHPSANPPKGEGEPAEDVDLEPIGPCGVGRVLGPPPKQCGWPFASLLSVKCIQNFVRWKG